MLKKLRNKIRVKSRYKALDVDTYRLLSMNKRLTIKRSR